jgi:hypothetical protein
MNDEDAKVAELWAKIVELEKKAQLRLEDWNGEDWLEFARAAVEISDKLAIPLGPAEAQLRELCGSGKIRAITLPLDVNEAPEFYFTEPMVEGRCGFQNCPGGQL